MLHPVARVSASAFALALLTGAAAAANGTSLALFSQNPIAYSWSGFYFGGHGGWGFGSEGFADGAIAGVQAGVNWQYGRFVVGFEGDGSWVDWNDADTVVTGRARAGFAFGRLVAYGTGGLVSEDGLDRVGWVAGGGAELAFAPNWTAGIEYLHYDFNDGDSDVVRGRLNYKFGDANAAYGDARAGIFSEARLGGLGFWQGNSSTEEGAYVTGQVLFDPFVGPFNNRYLNILLRPRPHLGGNFSPDGTDQIFAGVTWEFPFGRYFFAEASFGGTVHNGPITGAQVSLGCSALFRESLGLGANIGGHWRVIASVDHSSHNEWCSNENDGLTHIGASIGYRF